MLKQTQAITIKRLGDFLYCFLFRISILLTMAKDTQLISDANMFLVITFDSSALGNYYALTCSLLYAAEMPPRSSL